MITLGTVLTLLWPVVGYPVLGLSLLALIGWLMVHDVARRTIRAKGLARFMGLAVGEVGGLDLARQIGGALNIVALLRFAAIAAASAIRAGSPRRLAAVPAATPTEADSAPPTKATAAS